MSLAPKTKVPKADDTVSGAVAYVLENQVGFLLRIAEEKAEAGALNREKTRAQLLEINRRFYAAHAEAFDRSRGARPWAGWDRLRPWLAARSKPDAA